jgi:hypothetical protein
MANLMANNGMVMTEVGVVVVRRRRWRRQDMDNVVRLCLEQLGAPQRACSIIRETRSANGAREIAKYSQARSFCMSTGLLLKN